MLFNLVSIIGCKHKITVDINAKLLCRYNTLYKQEPIPLNENNGFLIKKLCVLDYQKIISINLFYTFAFHIYDFYPR